MTQFFKEHDAEYHTGEPWDQFCIPRCGVSDLDDLKALMEEGFSC
jgi:hypothetical protein